MGRNNKIISKKISEIINKVYENTLDLIYPRHCPVCNKIVIPPGGKICNKCVEKIDFIKEPRCKKCGKQIEEMDRELCYDCKNKSHKFKTGIALVNHSGEIKKSIYSIKYNNKREYVDFFVEEIVKKYEEEIKFWDAELIVAVPLHKRKLLKRGFNQAEVIAKRLSKKTGIPYCKNYLLRVKNTRAQKELNDVGRKKNLKGAFKINSKKSKHFQEMFKKIIIVDDIYTTGSTIDACSEVLYANGAKDVFFVCLSSGNGY